MAKVGMMEATRLTGKAKTTLRRAIKGGQLSCTVGDEGRKLFDPAELERWAGRLNEPTNPERTRVHNEPTHPNEPGGNGSAPGSDPKADLGRQFMQERISELEGNLERLRADLTDSRRDVVDWRVRYDKLFDTHSRLMLTGPTPTEDPTVREEPLRGPETSHRRPRYVRPTNGADPLLRVLHRVRGRLGDWLGV